MARLNNQTSRSIFEVACKWIPFFFWGGGRLPLKTDTLFRERIFVDENAHFE